MSEILDVVRTLDELREIGGEMALATIVSTSGSTYRRAGARLLVLEDGSTVGNISGGCLESEVQESARRVLAAGRPELLRFDLTADDEAVWGWGLGCNGVIDVLVEPTAHAVRTAATLRQALESDEPLVVIAVCESDVSEVEPGSRIVLRDDGTVEGSLGKGDADAAAIAAAEAVRSGGESRTVELNVGGSLVRVFIEVLLPQPRLIVCGAGHDAIPLVEATANLGWHVCVVDDRESLLHAERFPKAAELTHVALPLEAAAAVGVDPRTYVVVMSHNYLRDIDYLGSFLGTECAYIGVLGPHRRLARLLEDLAKNDVHPPEDDLTKLHGPAGLDVGAEGPEEIAAAIVAELLAVRRGRTGGFLRDRRGPIHDKPGHVATP